jgi:thiol peroxidase
VTLDKSADYFDQVATGKVSDYTGYKLIHTVPSLDTPVCTKQTKELEATAKLFPNTPILIISNDTPFALKRFCLTNDISNVQVFSDARTREFGIQNGLFLPQYGLLTRSIMIVDQDMKVVYINYEEEITHGLDIANALGQLNALVNPPLQ